MNLRNLLDESCKEIGVILEKEQIEQFIKYKDLLLEWNKNINLTAITDEKEVVLKHFVDSISITKGINIKDNLSIIDVGTGAGFPGIPIKIVFPNTKITLMDSLNKRILFLEEVIKELRLTDIYCTHLRAEDGGQTNEYREQFDICVSRAVAKISVLSEYCIPFVKLGGYFISLKGSEVEDEILDGKNAIKKLGGEIVEVKKIQIPNTDIRHSLVIIKKINQTPSQYPRKSGKASKNPII